MYPNDTTGDWHTARWRRLRRLFHRIEALEGGRRRDVLSRLAGRDPGMAQALNSLLSAHDAHRSHTDQDRRKLLKSALHVLQTPQLQVGDTLGPYRLGRELGRGGMGVVYLAHRAVGQVSQQVAVKVLAGHPLDDADTRRRFHREQEILATLDHPNIARFLDTGETPAGAPYVVMEYVPGIPLTAYCDALALDLRQRLRLFLVVCDAVAHAHARLVLHRDIKPGNVLVTADGMVKLIDFGIATPLRARTEITRTERRFFSPINAAPEQLRGERPTIACDVYQLGTLLYELLCGRPIFDLVGLTPAELESRIREHPPEPPASAAAHGTAGTARVRAASSPSALAARLRGDLDNITLHALRKAPRERYASVEKLAEDVGHYLARRPVRARRGQRLYRMRKFISRNRLVATGGALFLGVVSALLLTLYLQAQNLQLERDQARRDQARADVTAAFLADVFRTADPGISLVRDMRISEVLGNAEQRLRDGDATTIATRVQLLGVLADVRLKRGEYAIAHELLDEGEALLATAAPGRENDLLRLGLIETRARLAGTMGYARQAHDLAGQALDLHDRLGHGPARGATARHTRVRALAEFAAPSVALDAYQSLYAAMRDRPDADTLRLARVEVQLAQLLMAHYDYARAGTLMDTAVARMQQELPEGHPDLLWILGAQANYLDQAQGRSAEAVQRLEQLYRRQTELFGQHSLPAATTRRWIGQARHRLGDPAGALIEIQRAYDLYARAHLGASTDLVHTLAMKAGLHAEQGRPERALAAYRQAAEMARELWGEDAYRVAELNARLAVILAGQGEHELPRRLLQAAIAADPEPTAANLWKHVALAGIEANSQPAAALARLDRIAPLLHAHAHHLPPELLRGAESAKTAALTARETR